MYHIFFIHLSIDGYLLRTHVLAILNNTAVNIEVHVPFWTTVCSEYMSSSGIMGSYGNSIFTLLSKGLSILFFMVAVPIYISTNSFAEFPFLHILSNIYYL